MEAEDLSIPQTIREFVTTRRLKQAMLVGHQQERYVLRDDGSFMAQKQIDQISTLHDQIPPLHERIADIVTPFKFPIFGALGITASFMYDHEIQKHKTVEEARKAFYNTPLGRRALIADQFHGLEAQLWRKQLSSFNPDAIKKAEELAKSYKVKVLIVPTDADFDSDEALKKVISREAYFISNNSWEQTAAATEYLLKYERLKSKLSLEIANEKRISSANQASSELSAKIAEIKHSYQSTHEGKEPSLGTIAQILNEREIDSPSGKGKWVSNTVKRIIDKYNTP